VIEGTSKPMLKIAAATTATNMIFVDSGAFTAFTKDQEMDWSKVLTGYMELVGEAANPSNLFLVAPDVIGNAAATMDLQTTYLDKLVFLARKGANLIVPIQKGGHLEDARRHFEMLYSFLGSKLIVGIPSNKMAWTAQDARDIVSMLKPSRVHLLGIGPGSTRFPEYEQVIRELSGALITIYTDSVPSGFRDFSVNGRCKEIRKEFEDCWKDYDDTELFQDALADLSDSGLEKVALSFGLPGMGISVERFQADVANGIDLEDEYSFLLTQPYSFLFEQALRQVAIEDTDKDRSMFRTAATREHILSLMVRYNKNKEVK
jgi:hypothetical protein